MNTVAEQGNNVATTLTVAGESAQEKTFTQAELDKIVQDRLARDRKDRADYDELKKKAEAYDAAVEAAKTDLEKATEKAASLQAKVDAYEKAETLRVMREKVAAEKGVPVSLLSGETEEACEAQADEIIKFAKPSTYPSVRDAGEAKGTPKGTTRQQFAEWAEKALN